MNCSTRMRKRSESLAEVNKQASQAQNDNNDICEKAVIQKMPSEMRNRETPTHREADDKCQRLKEQSTE